MSTDNDMCFFSRTGNKCDWVEKRAIATDRGEELAREYGMRFAETSARSGYQVERVFMWMTEDILRKMERRNPTATSGDAKITGSAMVKDSSKRKSGLFGKKCVL